jgi:hypothetical protein
MSTEVQKDPRDRIKLDVNFKTLERVGTQKQQDDTGIASFILERGGTLALGDHLVLRFFPSPDTITVDLNSGVVRGPCYVAAYRKNGDAVSVAYTSFRASSFPDTCFQDDIFRTSKPGSMI